MSYGQMLKDLPEECILNVSSFPFGDARVVKIKHNTIMKKYIRRFKPKIEHWQYGGRVNITFFPSKRFTVLEP